MDHSAVQAYSHWTHHVTDGKIMVVDCQGAFDAGSRTFNLTDPAVHCTDMTRFDRTNLGGEGMRRFFSTHKCNDHCRTLGISSTGLPDSSVFPRSMYGALTEPIWYCNDHFCGESNCAG